ncbi:MAG: hypothetical protein RR336_04010 [Oscillospiraceae bacterium]
MEREKFVAELLEQIAEKLAQAQKEVYLQLLREKLGLSAAENSLPVTLPKSDCPRHILHRVITCRDIIPNAVIMVRRDAIVTHQAAARAAELGATLRREEEVL